MELHLSELDTDRFGISVAKMILKQGDSVVQLFDLCIAAGVKLLIARVAAEERDLINELEAGGASLADTLLYHSKAIEARHAIPLAPAFRMRLANADDASSVEALARRAFNGYTGHYHNDVRLDKRDANEVYASWARNCCLKMSADEVFVVEHKGEIIAFAAVRRIDDATIDCPLCAVESHWRGRRLLDALLTQCESWALDKGYASIEYSTHCSNVQARSVIERSGFVAYRSVHTYHKWFNAH
ncbi:GNAT family N-acetyltransferase [Paraburkholderia fungorum]|uniref:GNAT family N-acetyltransferase n=1 Tax=Paraburkholderia fungorum TaxID=134537 RepID=UPI0038BCF8B2